jgi:uncharacterized oxidoreductase
MKISGSTILVTGGGSGIGRALAEGFHRRGAQVIVAGRRRQALEEVVTACPGLAAAELDVADPADIARFAREVTRSHPRLNVLVNNAGVMVDEDLTVDPVDVAVAEATVTTNLLGPIRLTAALLPHLRQKDGAAVLNVTSGLASVPLARTPTYCATKAALHSYSLSLREQLKGRVEVVEVAPPYVQTHLQGERQANDPNAMPLEDYIAETFALLEQQPTPAEVLVERVKFLRFAEAEGRFDQTFKAINGLAH